jgi:HAAS domain-containing protein
VAQDGLIERYLAELRTQIAHTRDHLDTLAEVEDHLSEAVARLRTEGWNEVEAEQKAVTEFGSPTLVARAVKGEGKGVAIPTSFTRVAGLAAMASSILVAFGALFFLFIESSRARAWTFAPSAAAALMLLVVAILGIRSRHGRVLGGFGRAAMIIAVAAFPLSLPFGWSAGVALAAMESVALVLLAAAMFRAEILPRGASATLGGGFVVAMSVGLIGAATGGDAASYALLLGSISAFGLAWIGWAMWSEHPVSNPSDFGGQLA